MTRGLLYLPFLLLVFFSHSVVFGQASSDQTDWTEKKLGKIIMRADRAARKRQWSRAIRHGEHMLQGLKVLNQPSDARYIKLLKNINKYYDQANQLHKVAPRVKRAYDLSREHLGIADDATVVSRRLYYKLLTSHKDYKGAIPLVLESTSILGESEEDLYKLHRYLQQLYSLYGITGQLKKEEKTLLKLLKLNKRLFGDDLNDNLNIILNLAKNYCLQRKAPQFNQLMASYNLKYEC